MVDVLFKSSSYVAADLNDTLFELMDGAGDDRIQPGMRVLIKPNFLLPAGPERGITTHPLIVKAVVKYVLDMTLCKVLGLDPALLQTHRAAQELGLLPERINLQGGFHVVDDFAFPDIGPLTMGPKMLHGFMRRNNIQKPVVNNNACKLCGECWKYCPHGVIRMHEPLLGKLVRPYLYSAEP